MIKIWGRPTSGCSQRALWCIGEAGLPYQLTLASNIMGPDGHISRGGQPFGVINSPDYRAMNPNGNVPTINDNDFILWESNAILAYIALKYAPSLYGGSPETLARCVAWGSWANERLDSIMAPLVLHYKRLAKPLRDPKLLEKARTDMPKQLQTLEDRLAKQPYLSGDDFTIADISIGPSVHRWFVFDLERPRMPHLEDWHARLTKRPAFQKHIAPREFHIEIDD